MQRSQELAKPKIKLFINNNQIYLILQNRSNDTIDFKECSSGLEIRKGDGLPFGD